jgi:hypothetical protein
MFRSIGSPTLTVLIYSSKFLFDFSFVVSIFSLLCSELVILVTVFKIKYISKIKSAWGDNGGP